MELSAPLKEDMATDERDKLVFLEAMVESQQKGLSELRHDVADSNELLE